METITEKYVQQYIKPRNPETHKGDYGRVLIIAGSPGMGGAAIMCGKAALRSGAGLVTLCVPKELFSAIHSALPEVTCVDRNSILQKQTNTDTATSRSDAITCPTTVPAPSQSSPHHIGYRASGMWQSTALDLSLYNAIAIGPGLGTEPETTDLLSEILHSYNGKLIIDADALNGIAKRNIPLSEFRADGIITPHPGEAARLLCTDVAKINEAREASAKELSSRYHAVTVLKGHGTIVATPEGNAMINETGNPGMATGGSGDVLTGIITALAAQGLSTYKAATCGVYLHGLAGDIAADKLGEYSLIASDIIDALPLAFLEIVSH